jgi:endonuclease YncB( thermonuclease family)
VINDTNTTCRGNALCINSTVKKIVDGDTLDIGNYRVRLSLVNTPEYYQKGFAEASTFTKNFCKIGSKAIVDQDDLQPKDIYGRIVGVVYCGGKNLNENLLINNHATIIRYYCRTSEFSGDSWAKKYGC